MRSQLAGGGNQWCYYDIQSGERQKICQQQLRLGDCISRRWEGERRSGWHLWMEKRLTEKDELDLDRLVCGSRCSVGHWMGLLESGAGDN